MADSMVTENDANLRLMEIETGRRSNDRHEHTVDDVVYVASGRVQAVENDEQGDLCLGRLVLAPSVTLHRDLNDSPKTMERVLLLKPAPPGREVRPALFFGEDAAV